MYAITKNDASTSDIFKLKVQQLTATNYYVWSNKMEVVLRGTAIQKFVDSAGPDVTNNENTMHNVDSAMA